VTLKLSEALDPRFELLLEIVPPQPDCVVLGPRDTELVTNVQAQNNVGVARVELDFACFKVHELQGFAVGAH